MTNKKIFKLTVAALMVALSVVLAQFTINVSEGIQFGIAEFPIIFAGMILGPLYGGLVGLVKDIFTMMQRGYPPSLFTVATIALGVIPGVLVLVIGRKRVFGNVFLTMLIVLITLLCRTFINSIALHYVVGLSWQQVIAVLPPKLISIVIETIVYGLLLTALIPAVQKKFGDKIE